MNERAKERRTGSNGGFTLIEVLLVVAILGILATVVVVNFSGKGETAKINATRASIANVATAVSMYEVSLGKFPSSLKDLTVDVESFNAPLSDVPVDSWGTEFQYKTLGRGKFEIRSAGPDASFGTEDDLVN